MATNVLEPSFGRSVIDDHRSDGYWVETFHFSKDEQVPGVIASGLVSGNVEFLDNPLATEGGQSSDQWKKYDIAKFDSPVAVVACDITGNGLTDVVVCHDYGPFMLECNMAGGWISWLENPGRDNLGSGQWKERRIGRWPAMHRLKAGHFTQKSFLEIVAASVVRGEHDKTTPIPIIRFQAPENVLDATEWSREIIDDEHFTVIHEVQPVKLDGPNGLESLLISSREGTTLLYFDNGKWERQLIGVGEPKEPNQSPTSEAPGSGDHWGTGCADMGCVSGNRMAYIATLDPFHGIAACVYIPTSKGPKGAQWKRHVLDIYGTPNQLKKTGDGPGHHLVCADFDGDGDDEFILSLFGSSNRDENEEVIAPQAGPDPNKGIMYYKAIDVKRGLFAKWKISDDSSARTAIGNFGGNGKLDIVSVRYNVARYYEEPNPLITVHLNEFAEESANVTDAIAPTLWDNEGLVHLARPSEVRVAQRLPLIEIADYALSVEIHPRGSKVDLQPGEGIKVLYGSVTDGDIVRSAFNVDPFPAIAPVTSSNTMLDVDDEKGTVLLRIVPIGEPGAWKTAQEVPVKTTFDTSKYGINFPDLQFKKVEDLWWGSNFKGVDFYNLSGFTFRFDDAQIAHIQFWTAGRNVNCGVHNHSGDMFQEIHVGLSPGTENGGMSCLKNDKDGKDAPDDKFEHVPIPRLYEHGGLWHRDSNGNPIRGKDNVVAYPWHKWQAGNGHNVDVWMAVEYNPNIEL